MKDQKPVLLGASAVFWIVGAIHSRASRRNAALRRRPSSSSRTTSLENTKPIEPIATIPKQSTTKNTINPPQRSDGGSSKSNLNILLLLQGLISIIALALSQHIKPPQYQYDLWKQHLGASCIALLLLHLIVRLILSTTTTTSSSTSSKRSSDTDSGIDVDDSYKQRIQLLAGNWSKDKHQSDSMDGVCDLMEMNPLIRAAIKLIKGVDLSITPSETSPSHKEFKISVISGILWFKINETFPLNSDEEVRHSRRDFRRGWSYGKAKESTVHGGCIEVVHRFEGVRAGTMHEAMYCPEENVLYVDTVVKLNETQESVSYRQVYTRRNE